MATKEEILESISKMSVMDLVDLIKEIEEKFDVSAAAVAAPVAVAAGGASAEAGGEAAEEKPILFWKDGSDSYFSALWMNEKTRTLTVLEYPNGPEIACFTSTGKDAVWSKNKELKTKGSAIRYLTQ